MAFAWGALIGITVWAVAGAVRSYWQERVQSTRMKSTRRKERT